MKPKINRKAEPTKAQPFDRCQTPDYALDPLLPYLPKGSIIWEPCAGDGYLAAELRRHGFIVIESDILTHSIGPTTIPGANALTWAPPRFDLVVTNPPFTLKFPFYKRLYGLGKPFAMLLPLETIGAGSAQAMYKTHGHEQLLLDKRVNFGMPNKKWEGSSAQFPVFWSCWRLLPAPVIYGEITRREQASRFVPYALLPAPSGATLEIPARQPEALTAGAEFAQLTLF